MSKRPLSITLIGMLFIAAGVVGFTYHLTEINLQQIFSEGLMWVLLIRLLAIVGGVFLLRGNDWARWLLLAWLAYHVVLSAFHTAQELIIHGLLLATIAYFLYRPPASSYFRET